MTKQRTRAIGIVAFCSAKVRLSVALLRSKRRQWCYYEVHPVDTSTFVIHLHKSKRMPLDRHTIVDERGPWLVVFMKPERGPRSAT